MRAVQIASFGGPENLQVVDVPRPEPGPNEVLIRVVRCGVNPVDRSQLIGRWQWLQLPHIPGSEIAGTVEMLGPGVGGLTPGQRVGVAWRLFCGRCHYCLRGHEQLCMSDPRTATAPAMPGAFTEGGYAEYAVVPAANAIPLPDNVDFDAACTATLDGVTAWHMMERARVAPGDHVHLATFYAQEQEIVGSTGGSRVDLVQCLDAMARGALKAVVYKRFPLASAAAAIQALGDQGRLGKIVLEVA